MQFLQLLMFLFLSAKFANIFALNLAGFRADPWEGTFDAVHTYKLCPQIVSVAFAYDELIPYKNPLNHDGNSSDEDCLRLNLFTTECNKDAKLPVR